MSRLIALLLIPMLVLSGCNRSRQVENQAYVIVMGLDRTDDGGISITAQMPKISKADQSEDGSSGGGYLKVSVSGRDYASAMEALSRTVPRTLNLSQLKLLILSEEFARQPDCGTVLAEIARNRHLFAAAQIVVTEGGAREFVESMGAVMGSRLSADIASMLDHYIRIGCIPDSKLADFYYLTESIYSDPITIYAYADDSSKDLPNRYAGCALFSEGRMVARISADEAIFINLLRGGVETFKYRCNGESVEFTLLGKPDIRVETDQSPMEISVRLRLSVRTQEAGTDAETIQTVLCKDIMAVVQKTQRLRVEPFGFSEIAARSFPTIAAFRTLNRHDAYAQAVVNIYAEVSPVSA